MTKTNDQFSTLTPLFALGIIVILAIIVYGSFLNTANMKSSIIIPGGVTYLGK
ncbi:MAG: hypothetical protein V1917_02250 [Candidatus Gottesmanbacteria bacterium]